MFKRLLRWLVQPDQGDETPEQPRCQRCEDLAGEVNRLKQEVYYWRMREERTVDRLLEVKGIPPVAAEPKPPPRNPLSMMMHAINVTEIDSTKDPLTAAGPDAMSRGAHN